MLQLRSYVFNINKCSWINSFACVGLLPQTYRQHKHTRPLSAYFQLTLHSLAAKVIFHPPFL